MSTSRSTSPRGNGRKPTMPAGLASEPPSNVGPIPAAMTRPATALPIDPETKRRMIAEAAYYCAERRGFVPGGDLQDWLEAEIQVELLLER